MDLKWLEDYLALVEHRGFSKAARHRHVTQPAFSRRIRALEQWLGVTLVDRSRPRLQLTDVGRSIEADIRRAVDHVYELRSRARAENNQQRRVIFTTQHTLTLSFFPWLMRVIDRACGRVSYRVRSANKDDCVTMLLREQADFLICYEAEGHRTAVPRESVVRLRLTDDRLVAVATPTSVHGRRVADQATPLALLSFPEDSFFGQVLRAQVLSALMKARPVEIVCESAFTGGLKEMALNGMGIAWLPYSLVRHEIADGRLSYLGAALPDCELEIVLYRRADAGGGVNDRIMAALIDRVRQPMAEDL